LYKYSVPNVHTYIQTIPATCWSLGLDCKREEVIYNDLKLTSCPVCFKSLSSESSQRKGEVKSVQEMRTQNPIMRNPKRRRYAPSLFLPFYPIPFQNSVPMPNVSGSCPFPGVDSCSYSIVHFPNLSQSAIQRKQGFLPLHIFIMTSMSSLSKTLHSPITTREHDDWDVEDVVVYWC